MEAKGFRQVRFFHHIDEPADAVENSAPKKQHESCEVHIPVHVSDEEHDHPAHEQVEEGIEYSWHIIDEHLGQNPEQCNGPDHNQHHISLGAFQDT